jgi:hypothetical protein
MSGSSRYAKPDIFDVAGQMSGDVRLSGTAF